MSQLQLHEIMAAIKQKLYLKTQPWLLNNTNPVSCFACKGFNFVISYFYHRISFLRWNQKLNASSPSLLFVIQAVLPTLDTRNLFILRVHSMETLFPLMSIMVRQTKQNSCSGSHPSPSPNSRDSYSFYLNSRPQYIRDMQPRLGCCRLDMEICGCSIAVEIFQIFPFQAQQERILYAAQHAMILSIRYLTITGRPAWSADQNREEERDAVAGGNCVTGLSKRRDILSLRHIRTQDTRENKKR